jgi:hypothetical protein
MEPRVTATRKNEISFYDARSAKNSRLFRETFWGKNSFWGFSENSRQKPADLAG